MASITVPVPTPEEYWIYAGLNLPHFEADFDIEDGQSSLLSQIKGRQQ